MLNGMCSGSMSLGLDKLIRGGKFTLPKGIAKGVDSWKLEEAGLIRFHHIKRKKLFNPLFPDDLPVKAKRLGARTTEVNILRMRMISGLGKPSFNFCLKTLRFQVELLKLRVVSSRPCRAQSRVAREVKGQQRSSCQHSGR